MAQSSDTPQVLLFAGQFAVRGQCAYTLRLAQSLPEKGYRALVVCPNAQTVPSRTRQTLQIREYPHLLQPLVGRVVLEILLRQLLVDPPEIVHAQTLTAFRAATWIARELERPLILTIHDFLRPRVRLSVDRRVCRRVIAVSDAVRTHLIEQHHLPPDLVTVISSGVSCRRDEPVEPVLNPAKTPVVGTAGPLEAVKGFPFFLGAAARVHATGRDVEFLVAGAGPEEQNLRRLARELEIAQRVTFLPNLSDFSPALEAMDVFCLPSLRQGLGTIMLEAMALGRPVIATKVGGVFQVIRDGETGLLVPPSDSAQLAEKILELLDDPEKARRLGQAARAEVAANFSVEKMVEQTVGVYRAALAEFAVRDVPAAAN
jgi:glycosyltransferase involved in cell wall biosynthesis